MKGSNAPEKLTKPPMPKCKPPKGYWEIPSFMLKKRKGRFTHESSIDSKRDAEDV